MSEPVYLVAGWRSDGGDNVRRRRCTFRRVTCEVERLLARGDDMILIELERKPLGQWGRLATAAPIDKAA